MKSLRKTVKVVDQSTSVGLFGRLSMVYMLFCANWCYTFSEVIYEIVHVIANYQKIFLQSIEFDI